MTPRRFFVAYAALSTLLIATDLAGLAAWDWPVKWVPVAALVWYVLRAPPFAGQLPVAFALACGAGGDLILAWAGVHRSHPAFIAGLVAFLVGHVAYAVAWWPQVRFRPARVPHLLVVATFAAAMLAYLWPRLPDPMHLPIVAYVVGISTNAALAGLRRAPRLTVPFGMLAFLASDAFIAQNVFVAPFPGAAFFILSTYFLAQGLIAGGVVRDPAA
jgi:uncharacterized membrane protein YhhN